jgi:hypothetical protein
MNNTPEERNERTIPIYPKRNIELGALAPAYRELIAVSGQDVADRIMLRTISGLRGTAAANRVERNIEGIRDI